MSTARWSAVSAVFDRGASWRVPARCCSVHGQPVAAAAARSSPRVPLWFDQRGQRAVARAETRHGRGVPAAAAPVRAGDEARPAARRSGSPGPVRRSRAASRGLAVGDARPGPGPARRDVVAARRLGRLHRSASAPGSRWSSTAPRTARAPSATWCSRSPSRSPCASRSARRRVQRQPDRGAAGASPSRTSGCATTSPPDRAGQRARCPRPGRLDEGITFDGVGYTYPGTDRPALDGASVSTFPAGSVVAIVGEYGSGKTTLVKLLAKFYRPDRGRVAGRRGRSRRRWTTTAWRAGISAAFQDFGRFHVRFGEAVGAGRPAALGRTAVAWRRRSRRRRRSFVLARLPDGL